jgi:hypothetical protein
VVVAGDLKAPRVKRLSPFSPVRREGPLHALSLMPRAGARIPQATVWVASPRSGLRLTHDQEGTSEARTPRAD